MKPQERRSINVSTEVYEALSLLQAEVRMKMKGQDIDYMLTKTAMTKIFETLVKNADVDDLASKLK